MSHEYCIQISINTLLCSQLDNLTNVNFIESNAYIAEDNNLYITDDITSCPVKIHIKTPVFCINKYIGKGNSEFNLITFDIYDIKCPITQEIYNCPVLAEDGYIYEKEALNKWFSDYKYNSPMTRKRIKHIYVKANFMVNIVNTFISKYPQLVSDKYTQINENYPDNKFERGLTTNSSNSNSSGFTVNEDGMLIYTFGLYPESHAPSGGYVYRNSSLGYQSSGTRNISRLDEPFLRLTVQTTTSYENHQRTNESETNNERFVGIPNPSGSGYYGSRVDSGVLRLYPVTTERKTFIRNIYDKVVNWLGNLY